MEIRTEKAECSSLKSEEGPTPKALGRQERGWARDGKHDHHHSSLLIYPSPLKKQREATCTEPRTYQGLSQRDIYIDGEARGLRPGCKKNPSLLITKKAVLPISRVKEENSRA